MAIQHQFDRQFFTESILGLFASLFIVGFVIILCSFGKKKKGSKASITSDDANIELGSTEVINAGIRESEVAVQAIDKQVLLQNSTQNETPEDKEEIEVIGQYDPVKSKLNDSQSTIHPYESVNKNVLKKDVSLSENLNGNSVSGSGNSDSGNSIYTKVKKVPKKEEIAYAVVDMIESQEKYEMVNGGIVRRQAPDSPTHTKMEHNEGIENAPNDNTKHEEEESSAEPAVQEENSAGSDLYASVKTNDTELQKESISQEVGTIDAYAVVIKAEQAVSSFTHAEEKEDSGASGFYAQVNNKSVSPQSQPPPPPPPHPVGMSKVGSFDKEAISQEIDTIDAYAVVIKAEQAVKSSTKPEDQDDSGASGFYAQVGNKSVSPQPPPPPPPPPPPHPLGMSKVGSFDKEAISQEIDTIDAYAVVIKAEQAVKSSTKPEDQEDSGASGFYAQVDNKSVSPQPQPPPLPPPHPVGMSKVGSFDKNEGDSSYEPIPSPNTGSLERSNTYDSISEVKAHSKVKRKTSKGVVEKHKHESKHKHKSLKKDGSQDASSKSPKTSRFSRVNPFKSSKKHKHKHSSENIHVDSDKSNEQEGDFELDKQEQGNEKGASLPTSARKSPTALSSHSTVKRNSSPHIPPPLPSVDKLIHLTEHNQKSRRGSSFDACSSPDSSPKSSPRTPLDIHSYHPKVSARSINDSGESKGLFSDTYSTIGGGSSVDPSLEAEEIEDDKYSTVDNALKMNILHSEDDKLEEEDKYTTVKDKLKVNLSSEKPYDKIKDLKRKPKDAEVSVSGDGAVQLDDIHMAPGPVEDFPDYAMVDLTMKQNERSKSITAEEEEELKKQPSVVNEDYAMVDLSLKHKIRSQSITTEEQELKKQPSVMVNKEAADIDKDYEPISTLMDDGKTKRFSSYSDDYMYVE